MVVRAVVECSWCLLSKGKRVPGHPLHISFGGDGGLYDLCKPCAEMLIEPFVELKRRKLVRANRQEDLPDGWYGDAWPGAKQAIDITSFGPQGPAPVSGEGGDKPVAQRKPRRKQAELKYLCPIFECTHKELTSQAGIAYHVDSIHDHVTLGDLLTQVTICGFCGERCKTPSGMGRHVRIKHADIIPAMAQGITVLMISHLRRTGEDPYGALTKLREYSARYSARHGRGTPPARSKAQPALEDSTALLTSETALVPVGANHDQRDGA